MSQLTDSVNYQPLVSLGLSQQEARVYVSLLEYARVRPSQLGRILQLPPPSVHRTLAVLAAKGFAIKLDGSPAQFQAVSPKLAVNNFAQTAASHIVSQRDQAIHALSVMQPKANTAVQLITGAQQWYQLYCEHTLHAQQEILVISIGEQVHPEVRQAFAQAALRGVKHRFIFHRYEKDNEAILKGWLSTGDTQVRYFQDAGYHLVIWDRQELALVASNPAHPNERSGMLLKSPRLADSLRNYFFTIWDQANPITTTSFLPN